VVFDVKSSIIGARSTLMGVRFSRHYSDFRRFISLFKVIFENSIMLVVKVCTFIVHYFVIGAYLLRNIRLRNFKTC